MTQSPLSIVSVSLLLVCAFLAVGRWLHPALFPFAAISAAIALTVLVTLADTLDYASR